MSTSEPYDLAETEPAIMLRSALARAKAERGLSIRQLAKQLGFNQAVVISHMALGRMPIPIDRAEQLAEALGMDPGDFLSAVVHQRHPTVKWGLLGELPQLDEEEVHHFINELEEIAGEPIINLSAEHRHVLREVVASARPKVRWISEHELPVVALIRKIRPGVGELGLQLDELVALEVALQRKPI